MRYDFITAAISNFVLLCIHLGHNLAVVAELRSVWACSVKDAWPAY